MQLHRMKITKQQGRTKPYTKWIATFLLVAVPVAFAELQMGKPKSPNVKCFSRDQLNYWCEFSERAPTGLSANFTMEYTEVGYEYDPPESAKWIACVTTDDCIAKHGNNSCCVTNSRYEQKVRVNHTNTIGSASTIVTIYPLQDAIPYPVTNIEIIKANSRSLTISWRKPAEWNYSALKYQILYTAIGSSQSKQLDINRSSRPEIGRTLKELLPYTNYSINIRSKEYVDDDAIWSDWSNITGTTLQEVPGSTVQALVYKNLSNSNNKYQRDLIINWQDVDETSRHGQIIGYNVYIKSVDGEVVAYRTEALSAKIPGLEKFKEYNVSVAAETIVGEGPNATFSLPDLTSEPVPPVMEAGFPDSKSSSAVEIKWKEPADPRGYVKYYSLQWSHNQADWEPKFPLKLNASQLSHVVGNLTGDTKYYFRLSACNKRGHSEWTSASVKTPKAAGIDLIAVGLSILGVCVGLTILLFLTYWLRKSDITKPAPEPYISEKAFKVELNNNSKIDKGRYQTEDQEIFDNLVLNPPLKTPLVQEVTVVPPVEETPVPSVDVPPVEETPVPSVEVPPVEETPVPSVEVPPVEETPVPSVDATPTLEVISESQVEIPTNPLVKVTTPRVTATACTDYVQSVVVMRMPCTDYVQAVLASVPQ